MLDSNTPIEKTKMLIPLLHSWEAMVVVEHESDQDYADAFAQFVAHCETIAMQGLLDAATEEARVRMPSDRAGHFYRDLLVYATGTESEVPGSGNVFDTQLFGVPFAGDIQQAIGAAKDEEFAGVFRQLGLVPQATNTIILGVMETVDGATLSLQTLWKLTRRGHDLLAREEALETQDWIGLDDFCKSYPWFEHTKNNPGHEVGTGLLVALRSTLRPQTWDASLDALAQPQSEHVDAWQARAQEWTQAHDSHQLLLLPPRDWGWAVIEALTADVETHFALAGSAAGYTQSMPIAVSEKLDGLHLAGCGADGSSFGGQLIPDRLAFWAGESLLENLANDGVRIEKPTRRTGWSSLPAPSRRLH